MTCLVAALYHFVSLPRFREIRQPLLDLCLEQNIKGTLLLASEGINGTIAGPSSGIHAVLGWLRSQPEFASLEHKESLASKQPFNRMKVRLKKEIVTLGAGELDPARHAGHYVAPQDWNALINDPDTIVIDTRNDYEVKIGTFNGAINPQTQSFRELPAWVAEHDQELRQKKKIAMFCTGGIRCEKSTAYLKAQGFEDVYHLKGGILKYLETIPAEQSLWQGECFVFDQRVSVGHGLQQGQFGQCYACRMPLSQNEMALPSYVKGVSCLHCLDMKSPEDRARFAERQKQMEKAAGSSL